MSRISFVPAFFIAIAMAVAPRAFAADPSSVSSTGQAPLLPAQASPAPSGKHPAHRSRLARADLDKAEPGQSKAKLPSMMIVVTATRIPTPIGELGTAASVVSGKSMEAQQIRQVNDALRETRNTLDLDFTHHFRWGSRQDVVWGVGYRYSSSTTDGNLLFSLDPPDLNTQLFSAFAQDEVALIPERLSLIAGAKIEHNYFTGFGVMPTLRATWALHQQQTVWAAISRSLRTPSEIDTASQLTVNGFVPPGGPPVLIRIVGNPAFQDEHELNYEAGYRIQLQDRLSVNLTAYYNSYSQLQTSEPEPTFSETDPPPPHIVMPLKYENLMRGETHGIEAFATWKVTSRWTLAPAYAFEGIHLHLDPSSQDTMSVAADQGSSPRQWARLGSHVALLHGLAWDVSANFVGRLANPAVASYTRIDSQISWHLREHLSASLVGQNLAQDHHIEFLSTGGTGFSSYMKRSGYAKLTWRF